MPQARIINWTDGAVDVPIIGCKVHYSDGSALRFRNELIATEWAASKGNQVQVVILYFARTYQIYRGWAREETLRRDTEHYRHMFHGQDYYWWSPTVGYGAGLVTDVPPDAVVKTGQLIQDDRFFAVYNAALDDTVF